MQRMQAIEAPIKNSWSFMLARTQLALMYFSLLDLLRAYYARVRASIYIYGGVPKPMVGNSPAPPLFPRDGAVLLGPFWGPFGTFRDIQNCYMYSMLPYARPNGTAICRD